MLHLYLRRGADQNLRWSLLFSFWSLWNKGTKGAKKYRGRQKKYRESGLAHQNERSPLIRMGIARSQCQHGCPEGSRLALSLSQQSIENAHVLCRALVMHVPQTQCQGLSPGMQKPARQADQFIACTDHVKPGRTSAQCYQLNRKPQLIEVEQTQKRNAQADFRKHHITLAEVTMGSDVNSPALAPFATQDAFARIWADKQFCLLQNAGERLNLLQDCRRLRIRDTQYEC